jgi:hypothetical protein
MRHIKLLLAASLFASTINAQIPTESQLFLTKTLSETNLQKEELLQKFMNFDFSTLWTKNDEAILGFIGDNYQRINVKYLAIIKNIKDPNIYYAYGKTKVKTNICQFIGEIELINIRKIEDLEKQLLYEEAKRQNDVEAIRRFSKDQFIILAKYTLFEDQHQQGTGIFKGILKTYFYTDSDKVYYDDLDIVSDIYSNNQYVGTWTSYISGSSKRCNWGEYRIPNSGDLDIGVGDFSPNAKYLNSGWNTYYNAYINNDPFARKDEKIKWW